MSEDREQEIVTGTVDSIVEKGESKWQVVVKTHDAATHGKKLWTKSADQITLVRSLLGQQATFECGVSEWTNQSGQPVRSLWINAINPGAPPPGAAQEATGSPQTASQPPGGSRPPANDPKQYSIERQAAGKAAAHRYQGTSASVDEVLYLAKRLAEFFQSGEVVAPEPEGGPPPLPVDENIPF